MSDAALRYAVGIDLGTANSSLSATSLAEQQADPQALAIPQVVSVGAVQAEALLPSFLYLPAPGELPAGALSLPWSPITRIAAGRFARDHGVGTPMRLVSSAKSWLCHTGVDRRANLLPFGAPEDSPKISPVDASTRLLEHLKSAWEEAHPEAPLEAQEIVLTVPASFDAVARELTVEAALEAGLPPTLRLLEEPQAALYAWLADRGASWRDDVAVGEHILVVDIGGGTTDFSLIRVGEVEGQLALERVAVGEHILLGGDNLDLALAHRVRARLAEAGTALDDWQMRALTHACRGAKERLLGEEAPEQMPLTLPSRGRSLFGGSVRADLRQEDIEAVVFEGFFPFVEPTARPAQRRRMGLQTFGLPYAADAAITRHLAAFLGQSALDPSEIIVPAAVLFNGGVTLAGRVRTRVVRQLGQWAEQLGAPAPRVLTLQNPGQAVSRGAAFYAHVCERGGVRIKGGLARSYYVGVERAELAVPGIEPQVDAICLAPYGMEEGASQQLAQAFGLYLGETVFFRFFASAQHTQDVVGQVRDPAELEELSPIETLLDGPADTLVPVQLEARVTAIGTLDLGLVDVHQGQRWKLSFNVRVE